MNQARADWIMEMPLIKIYIKLYSCYAELNPLPTADPAWQPTCNMNIASPIPAYPLGILPHSRFKVFPPSQSSCSMLMTVHLKK